MILADRETGEQFTDRMRQVFIALPLFKKEEDECENDFERWIYTLKNMETLKRMPFKARKAVFEKLEEIADVASLSKEERKRYENSVNVYRTHLCVLDAAEQEGLEKGMKEGLEKGMKEGLEKGMKEGLEKGMKKGLEKGLEKGIEEGLKQGREEERLFNARKMKERGYPLKDIEDVTGLSESEIAAL